jgi:hypothetical protein
MAKRKYSGTDAELLRMKREGCFSVRAIAAKVGLGKSVVAARIARAEAAERAQAESPASTQASSTPANSRAASATSLSDPHLAGPINVRAQLEAIAQDPKVGYRERLGALQTLAKMGETADRPSFDGPRRIGTLAAEPHRREDGSFTYRLWLRERPGWASPIHELSPHQVWALLGCALLAEELGEDFLTEPRAGVPAEHLDQEPEPGNDEQPETLPRPKARRSEPAIT